ncbi:MAG: WD40/YVTN/BNR-like repeat-containing protein [Acidimicrobiales bacterium]
MAPAPRRIPPAQRRRRYLYVLAAVIALAGIAIAATAAVIATTSPAARLGRAPGFGAGGGQLVNPQGAGALVPAADLVSDPVFVNLKMGFALETTERNSVTVERLARSDDGGRSWHISGAPFPVAGDFSTLQFISPRQGYVFGDSGLLVTSDGGRHWSLVPGLDGTLERAIPIGRNVWATFTRCVGVPGPSSRCPVLLAVSHDAGRHWHTVGQTPLTEAPSPSGGDVLARYSLSVAYLVSYGTSGGGLAETLDNGAHWKVLPDPCSEGFAKVDLAAPAAGQLWLICGALASSAGSLASPTSLASPGYLQPKVVYRSFDGGRSWKVMASSGFGKVATRPLGSIPLSGGISQLATISSTIAWLGLSHVGVIVSFDSGRDWQLAEGFRPGAAPSSVGVTFNNAVDGWAVAFRSGVWRTTDAIHWHLIGGA